jgi:hypothetical protein
LWAVLLAREPTELVRAIEILPRLVEDEMLAVVLAEISVSSWLFIELMSDSLRVVELFLVVDDVAASLVVAVVAWGLAKRDCGLVRREEDGGRSLLRFVPFKFDMFGI